MENSRKEFFKITRMENVFSGVVIDENGISTRLDKIEPIPYNHTYLLVSVGKKQRIIHSISPKQNIFPYDFIQPFSDMENKRFCQILEYHTNLQGYFYKKFDGTCVGLVVYFLQPSNFIYEIMFHNQTDKHVKEIVPITAIKISNNICLDFWKLIYTDNSHDILINDLMSVYILDGKKFM